MNDKVLRVLIIILSIIIVERVAALLAENKKTDDAPLPTVEVVEPMSEAVNSEDGRISFAVYPPENFNDKTKQDIYDMRKRNVGNSPLYPRNYEPSEEVFGQIVSSKPWRGKYSAPCESEAANTSRGEALLSPIVNNPNALIAPFALAITSNRSLDSDYCKAHDSILFNPRKIEYNAAKKLLEITYPIDDIVIGKNQYEQKIWLLLTALNARDAGYNYIAATDIQGGFFYDSTWDNYSQTYKPYDNIMKIVYNFHDYIHLGTSCGLSGGCNNISPRQAPMEFALSERNAKVMLKLWKKQPSSRNSAPDLYCNLIFE